jgi:hypothetical protein
MPVHFAAIALSLLTEPTSLLSVRSLTRGTICTNSLGCSSWSPAARKGKGTSSEHRPKKRLTRMLVKAAQSGTQNSASETHFHVRRPRPVVPAE